LKSSKPEDLSRKADRIAGLFLNEGHAKEAEKYAKAAVKNYQQAAFLAAEKKRALERKLPEPKEQDLLKRYRETRATYLQTLGQAYYSRKNYGKAEKLLVEAWRDNPTTYRAARTLGLIRARQKRDAEALDLLVTAVLSGSRGPQESEQTLRELFARLHPGQDLNSYLDKAYETKFPLPVHTERYQPTPKRGNRVVLAEVFTGAGCPPCVAADLGFDLAMERFTREEVAVVMYHVHIPRPDPLTNDATEKRSKYYGVRGVPSYVLDGTLKMGGGSRDMTKGFWEQLQPAIEKRLETQGQASLRVQAEQVGGKVLVKAAVSDIPAEKDAKEKPEYRVQIALVEQRVRYTGENGIRFHPMVVRALAGDSHGGFAMEGQGGAFDAVFDVTAIVSDLKKHLDAQEARTDRKVSFSEKKHEIDSSRLGVVAFVEDAKSKTILQSAYVGLERPAVSRREE
jgi:tetratricopeptide (TPR) repeat protein